VLSNLESATAVSLSPPTGITPVETVVIKGKIAGSFAITRNAGTNESVLEIAGGAKIRFEDITVDGKVSNSVYHRAIKISGAQTEVTLGNGAVIKGKRSMTTGTDGGTGVFVTGGAALVMDGGSAVKDCVLTGGYFGAGVYVYGSGSRLTINEGAAISDNTAYDCGGGVNVSDSGAVVMNGGTIRDNHLTHSTNTWGGGVFMQGHSSTFTMNDGEISGNNAGLHTYSYGGGVFLYGGIFTMNGGVIYGNEEANGDLKNTAGNSSAAFYKYTSTISNGTIVVSTTSNTIGTAH
jgi:hypothetical protein